MERTSGIMPVEMEAVWHLVVPGTGAMKQEAFVRARYLVARILEGRTLPATFPHHVMDERPATG
jgi:hypothetical protein